MGRGGEGYEEHAGGGEGDEEEDARGVGDGGDVVGGCEFGEEGGDNVGEEDDALGHGGADEVERRGEDDYVEDIVYEACCGVGLLVVDVLWSCGGHGYRKARMPV